MLAPQAAPVAQSRPNPQQTQKAFGASPARQIGTWRTLDHHQIPTHVPRQQGTASRLSCAAIKLLRRTQGVLCSRRLLQDQLSRLLLSRVAALALGAWSRGLLCLTLRLARHAFCVQLRKQPVGLQCRARLCRSARIAGASVLLLPVTYAWAAFWAFGTTNATLLVDTPGLVHYAAARLLIFIAR